MEATPGTLHPEYMKHSDQLSRVIDVYDGIDTAKRYLQQYSQEETNEYTDRQDIATLDNFVFRTVESIVNLVFRKSVDISGITNPSAKQWIESIDFTNSINNFAQTVLTNRIKEGYTFILIDTPAYNPDEVTNKAEQDALNIRPYFVNILRSDVISWKQDMYGEYTQIVIKEQYEIEDSYTTTTEDQIKVWNSDGTVEIWRDGQQYGETIETGLDMIPIVKIGSDLTPPLYDLAKINITHMNRDSEVSNYARIGGAAFLAVFGNLDDDDAPKTLGINKGLKFKDKTDSDVKWIEMQGTNYDMLKDRILYHEDQMDRIAVSFTTESINKTATQVNKESMSGESKVIKYATELEEGLNLSISLMGIYGSDKTKLPDSELVVNKDFDSAILTPEMVASYRLDYTTGIISYEKLIEILIAGEYFAKMDEKETEEEKTRLLNSEV